MGRILRVLREFFAPSMNPVEMPKLDHVELRVLRSVPKKIPVPAKSILKDTSNLGLSRTTVFEVLGRLKEKGIIRKAGRGYIKVPIKLEYSLKADMLRFADAMESYFFIFMFVCVLAGFAFRDAGLILAGILAAMLARVVRIIYAPKLRKSRTVRTAV